MKSPPAAERYQKKSSQEDEANQTQHEKANVSSSQCLTPSASNESTRQSVSGSSGVTIKIEKESEIAVNIDESTIDRPNRSISRFVDWMLYLGNKTFSSIKNSSCDMIS